jgi:tRNA G46 methylase TrmB
VSHAQARHFVHGWSVTDIDTYGDFAARLRQDASEAGMDLDVEHLYVRQYVSFRDEIRVEDVATAFDRALNTLLEIGSGRRAVCITHSTGGPGRRTIGSREPT